MSGAKRLYTWDRENRLIQVAPGAPTAGSRKVGFGYDYLGRRVWKKVWTYDPNATPAWVLTEHRKYVWSGWLMLLELDGMGATGVPPVRTYTWGLDLAGQNGSLNSREGAGGIGGLLAMSDPNDPNDPNDSFGDFVYFYDTNGNIGQLVNWSASVTTPPSNDWAAPRLVGHYEYDPYGTVTRQTGTYAAANAWRFSTKQFDAETEFAYFGYRYYSPWLGRFLAQDPVGESGAMLVRQATASGHFIPRDSMTAQSSPYRYVRNHPNIAVDPLGLQESQPATSQSCDYCGPDMTEFTRRLIKAAVRWRSQQPSSVGIRQRWRWMSDNGMKFDWWSEGRGDYRCPGRCPSGEKCRGTYWICDTCVHDHWIGNMMYGLIGRLLGFWEVTLNEAGEYVQGPGPGDPPGSYNDPPWDQAGYEIGYGIYNATRGKGDPPILQSDQQFCDVLKGGLGRAWTSSYKTFTREPPREGTDPLEYMHYPTPHALWEDYKDCQKCPCPLPKEKLDALPGGGFPNGFPGV